MADALDVSAKVRGRLDAMGDNQPLAALIQAVRQNPDAVGLILHGSHAEGMGDEESDHDLIYLLTDAGYRNRLDRGMPMEETTMHAGRKVREISYTCLRELGSAQTTTWFIRGLATARILLDKSGEVHETLQRLTKPSEDEARREAATGFDGYLNGFYRSMKAHRRGDELGTRLHAAESLLYLIRALFALERRYPPFHDRLAGTLDTLASQGWEPGELRRLFLEVLATADPMVQRALEDHTETLMRRHGFGHVVDAWGGEIERVKRF